MSLRNIRKSARTNSVQDFECEMVMPFITTTADGIAYIPAGTMFPPAKDECGLRRVFPKFTTMINPIVPIDWERCPYCKTDHVLASMTFVVRDSMFVCRQCFSERMEVCDHCGEVSVRGLHIAVMIGGKLGSVCRRCYNTSYVKCEECEQHMHSNLTSSVARRVLCKACENTFRGKNYRCPSCNRWVPKDSSIALPVSKGGDKVCVTCYVAKTAVKLPELRIGGYHKTSGNVLLSTVGGQGRHYGIEWEGENGKRPHEQDASLWQDLYKWHKMAEPKEDGSVSRGMEWATKPMDLKFHREFFGWDEFFALVDRHGFKAHESLNAGIHISVSNLSFKKSLNRGLAAFTFLWNNLAWRTEIKKFSRRRNKFIRDAIDNHIIGDDAWGYCDFFPDRFFTPRYVPSHLPANKKKDYSIMQGINDCISHNKSIRNTNVNFWDYDHGSCRKVRKPACIEVRIFKSTTVKETLIAAIELCDVFVDISTSKWTEESLRAMTWTDVCNAVPSTHVSLKNYLKSQKIWSGS